MEKTLRGDYNCYGLASPCPPIHGGPRNAFVLGRWRTLRETTTAYEPLEVAGSTEYHVDSDESVGECLLALAGFVALFLGLTYLALRFVSWERR